MGELRIKAWKWRHDGVCGAAMQTRCPTPEEFQTGHSDKTLSWLAHAPCCSALGFCGNTSDHCTCKGCIDSRTGLKVPWWAKAINQLRTKIRCDQASPAERS